MTSVTGEIHGGAIQAIFKMVKKMKSTEEME
jgi:citrate synthase